MGGKKKEVKEEGERESMTARATAWSRGTWQNYEHRIFQKRKRRLSAENNYPARVVFLCGSLVDQSQWSTPLAL